MLNKTISLFVSAALLAAPVMAEAKTTHATKQQIAQHLGTTSTKAQKTQQAENAPRYKVTIRKAAYTVSGSGYRLRTANYVPAAVTPQRAYVPPCVLSADAENLQLCSAKAMVVDQQTGQVLFSKNAAQQTPIASITKLMTAMVALDARPDMSEYLVISEEDYDYLKGTGSRLRAGMQATRAEMLHLALMSSENRAASALARYYPGGLSAFVAAMNTKAIMLGMTHSHFVDPTGLYSSNYSTAEDLVKMVHAAYQYPEIRRITTTAGEDVDIVGANYPMSFRNTNALVREGEWQIGLSKTGYISEAGRCLVMQAKVAQKPLIIVLLDSDGKWTRIGDANRVRNWLEGRTDGLTTASYDRYDGDADSN